MHYNRNDIFNRQSNFGFGSSLTEGVKLLLIANGIGFLLQLLTMGNLTLAFGLVPRWVWSRFFIWQPVTYMFLHGGWFHLFMNMFVLWMFGSEIERMWGQKAFLKYYFVTGIGGGLFYTLFALNSTIPTVGASGAIYGILAAYAMMFPERKIYLYFLFPVPARIFVLVIVVLELLSGISGHQTGVAHFAHLGGAIIGYFYMKKDWKIDSLTDRFKTWNAQRRMRVVSEKEEELERMRRLVDQILDKANEIGMENLTKDEKTFLKRASKILKKNKK